MMNRTMSSLMMHNSDLLMIDLPSATLLAILMLCAVLSVSLCIRSLLFVNYVLDLYNSNRSTAIL